MLLSGIICEYNPFHSGHKAHIDMTRELLGGDAAIVCVMSGNFVQRGEPAILTKHARTEAALNCGADLVLENPVIWSTASAERFALAGVSILAALGLDMTISFGSECGDAETLKKAADALSSDRAQDIIKAGLEDGLSYAAARQRAADALLGGDADIIKKPNNILGVEYLKAIKALGAEHISPLTFKRISTEHDGEEKDGLAPASLLREMLNTGEDAAEYMPPESAAILNREIAAGRAPVTLKSAESAILYRLRTMAEEDYAALPDASEGFYLRLMRVARTASSYAEILENTKTKRYAMSRIRRMVLASLLGITAEMQNELPPYIRVLGANDRGRKILRQAKKSAALPIITKPAAARNLNENARRAFETEALATDIYNLMLPDPAQRLGGTEWTRGPVIL